MPIKVKHPVHAQNFPFPAPLDTPAGADALPVCEEEVPSVFAT